VATPKAHFQLYLAFVLVALERMIQGQKHALPTKFHNLNTFFWGGGRLLQVDTFNNNFLIFLSHTP
jgi:hypothetical protein